MSPFYQIRKLSYLLIFINSETLKVFQYASALRKADNVYCQNCRKWKNGPNNIVNPLIFLFSEIPNCTFYLLEFLHFIRCWHSVKIIKYHHANIFFQNCTFLQLSNRNCEWHLNIKFYWCHYRISPNPMRVV